MTPCMQVHHPQHASAGVVLAAGICPGLCVGWVYLLMHLYASHVRDDMLVAGIDLLTLDR